MPNPPWDMKFDPDTGWSGNLNYNETNIRDTIASKSRAMQQSNYDYVDPQRADWFLGNNWINRHWAKCYKNITDKAQSLESISFKVCACHSGGKGFSTYGSAGASAGPVSGYGCRFTIDLFVPSADQVVSAASELVVPNVTSYNNSFNGVAGAVDTSSAGYTQFGEPSLFPPDKALVMRTATFPNAPALQPKDIMYIHARVTHWNSGMQWSNLTSSNEYDFAMKNMLRLKSIGDGWDFTLKPENRKFIWIYVDHKYEDEDEDAPNGPHWRKIKDVYQKQASGWVNLGKDDDE